MSASIPTVDRRSIPTVAIVGNDAVLVAAPATPVQLSHACLRYGFAVAVPVSWGDELVAAETLRRLAMRDKGPAVMCVCPYARSRLLTPGPDLEPFLVSLVPPPVATARYLRTAYGEHGVHITYIGSCPSGDDPAIDARLTPDAFLADLAERGIALSEQPLVFDSIVPPDRRRWCSLPGGVPNAEMLSTDSDARTLVEIDRDDVSTDLVQHIITREHVLLDLAPGLGCACSGAVGSVAPRGARGAVAALEPPHAPGPVIDLTVSVSLDAPTAAVPPAIAPVVGSPSRPSVSDNELLERRLDEMLGVQASDPRIERDIPAELEAELDADVAEILDTGRSAVAPLGSDQAPAVAAPRRELPDDAEERLPLVAVVAPPFDPRAVAAGAPTSASSGVGDVNASLVERSTYSVRRRTPPATPARYSGGGVPKATGTDGRPLPRAYVAKRRTPSVGIQTIDETPLPAADTVRPGAETLSDPLIDAGVVSAPTEAAPNVSSTAPAPLSIESSDPIVPPHAASELAAPLGSEPASVVAAALDVVTSGAAPLRPSTDPEPSHAGGAVAAQAPNQSAFRVLMFAVLLAVAAVVLYTLRP